MLQHYTLMKMKNKMKDFEVEYEEWLEVVKEYFTKELDKNLPQHKANEKLRYKLDSYQKNFLDFIHGSPTSIEVSGTNEETKRKPSGTTQEEKMQTKEPQDLISGTTQEEDVQLEKPQDLRRWGQEKKKPQRIQEQEKVEVIPAPKKEVSKIQYLEIELQTKLVGGRKENCRIKSRYRTISSYAS